MAYLEELLPEFRKGAKIRRKCWVCGIEGICKDENYSFYAHDVDADDWEVVPDKPIDWDYIIKNKCPCWFWDDDFEDRTLGFLDKIDQDNTKFPYGRDHNDWWCHCQPVNKDELTFFSEITK